MKKTVVLFFLLCPLFVYSQINKEDDSIILSDLEVRLLGNEEFGHSEELKKNFLDFNPENIKVTIRKDSRKNKIKVTIKNISKKNIYVPKIEIPDDSSPVNYQFLLKKKDGTEIEYIGAIGDIWLFTDEHFLLLKPNQSIKRKLDLSKFYDITENESYSVQYISYKIKSNILKMN